MVNFTPIIGEAARMAGSGSRCSHFWLGFDESKANLSISSSEEISSGRNAFRSQETITRESACGRICRLGKIGPCSCTPPIRLHPVKYCTPAIHRHHGGEHNLSIRPYPSSEHILSTRPYPGSDQPMQCVSTSSWSRSPLRWCPVAVDAACGTGQSATTITAVFQHFCSSVIIHSIVHNGGRAARMVCIGSHYSHFRWS